MGSGIANSSGLLRSVRILPLRSRWRTEFSFTVTVSEGDKMARNVTMKKKERMEKRISATKTEKTFLKNDFIGLIEMDLG
jgi:hypothetical protein